MRENFGVNDFFLLDFISEKDKNVMKNNDFIYLICL